MKMTKSNSYLGNHKLSLLFSESSIFDQVAEELTSFHEVHDKENSKLILEHIVHTNNKWMIYII